MQGIADPPGDHLGGCSSACTSPSRASSRPRSSRSRAASWGARRPTPPLPDGKGAPEPFSGAPSRICLRPDVAVPRDRQRRHHHDERDHRRPRRPPAARPGRPAVRAPHLLAAAPCNGPAQRPPVRPQSARGRRAVRDDAPHDARASLRGDPGGDRRLLRGRPQPRDPGDERLGTHGARVVAEPPGEPGRDRRPRQRAPHDASTRRRGGGAPTVVGRVPRLSRLGRGHRRIGCTATDPDGRGRPRAARRRLGDSRRVDGRADAISSTPSGPAGWRSVTSGSSPGWASRSSPTRSPRPFTWDWSRFSSSGSCPT